MDVATLYNDPRLLHRIQSTVERRRSRSTSVGRRKAKADQQQQQQQPSRPSSFQNIPLGIEKKNHTQPSRNENPEWIPLGLQDLSHHRCSLSRNPAIPSLSPSLYQLPAQLRVDGGSNRSMRSLQRGEYDQQSQRSLLSTSSSSSSLSSNTSKSKKSKSPKLFVPQYNSDVTCRTALRRSSSCRSLSSTTSNTSQRSDSGSRHRKDRRHSKGTHTSHTEKSSTSTPNSSSSKTFHKSGDQDVWVERFFMNKKLHPITYFRSVKTGECVRDEPPTGASKVVYLEELVESCKLQECTSSASLSTMSMDDFPDGAASGAEQIPREYLHAAFSPLDAKVVKELQATSPSKKQRGRRRSNGRNETSRGASRNSQGKSSRWSKLLPFWSPQK